jgi:multidrug transporter EmrE-like cation transporter
MTIANLPAPLFLGATVVFQSAAHILLKFSSHELDQLAHATKVAPTTGDASSAWLLVLFSLGNLAGLVGVLTYTGVLKKMPLHLAFPLTQGLVALGVLVIGSYGIFHESFSM